MPSDIFRPATRHAILAATAARRRLEDAGLADEPEARAALERVFARVEDVLEERVGYREAPAVLKAAVTLADAIGGKQVERTELKGTVTLAALVAEAAGMRAGAIPGAAVPARELRVGKARALPAGVGAGAAGQLGKGEAGQGVAPPVRRAAAAPPVVRRKAAKVVGVGPAGGAGGGGIEDLLGLEAGGGAKSGERVPGGGEGALRNYSTSSPHPLPPFPPGPLSQSPTPISPGPLPRDSSGNSATGPLPKPPGGNS